MAWPPPFGQQCGNPAQLPPATGEAVQVPPSQAHLLVSSRAAGCPSSGIASDSDCAPQAQRNHDQMARAAAMAGHAEGRAHGGEQGIATASKAVRACACGLRQAGNL